MNHFGKLLKEHPFFQDLPYDDLDFIAGCCTNQVFKLGEMIGREGEPADHFFLIREGKVVIQTFIPDRGETTIQTLGPGDIIGWSWLFPPYNWNFDVKAVAATRTIAIDGKCLRKKCDDNPVFGYPVMKKFAQVMIQRLRAARIQVLDVYHKNPPA